MQGIFQEIHFRGSFGSRSSGQRIGSRPSRTKLRVQSPLLKSEREPREEPGRREIENIHNPEQLVNDHSRSCQWIWDPFCGSGTIPLKARLQGRHVIASDVNPYACILTKAKLYAPQTKIGLLID